MDGWEWLAQVDPATIERERFKITAGALKRREGTQLGELHSTPKPAPDARIITALTKERERADLEHHRAKVRGELSGRIRELETTLARERREHERALAWQQKLSTMGRRFGGPSALGETA